MPRKQPRLKRKQAKQQVLQLVSHWLSLLECHYQKY